jgi:hypothetical protein
MRLMLALIYKSGKAVSYSVLSLFLTEWTLFSTCLIRGLDNINRWSVNLASIHWCGLLRSTSFYCSRHLILYRGLFGMFFVFLPVTMIPHCCTCHVKSLWWVGDHVKLCYSLWACKMMGIWVWRRHSIVILPMLFVLSS